MNVFDLIAPEDRARAVMRFHRRLAGGENELAEYQMIRKDGWRVFVEVSGHVIERDGQVVGIEAIARDTSERHALEEKLRREALHDPLTDLPNRTLLQGRPSGARTPAVPNTTELPETKAPRSESAPVAPPARSFAFEGVEVRAYRSTSGWHLNAAGYEVENAQLEEATRILFDPRYHGDTSSLEREIRDWQLALHQTRAV